MTRQDMIWVDYWAKYLLLGADPVLIRSQIAEYAERGKVSHADQRQLQRIR